MILLLRIYFMFVTIRLTITNGDYINIVNKIFKNYNPGLRPVLKSNTTTKVKLHYGIVELINVEQISKTLECQIFMEMIWEDEYLKWDPEEFGNTSSIRYPSKNVWLPDIILLNSLDTNKDSKEASTNVIIYSDGTVFNVFLTVYKAICIAMDMSKFPFDEHQCYVTFASWTYAGDELDLFDDMDSYEIADSLKLVPNPEWDITVQKSKKIVQYGCCPNGSYPWLQIPIVLKRNPLYYILNVFLPITVTCSVCFVGMFSPSSSTGERTEKVFLGITTLLAVSILLFSVSAQLPVTSNGLPTIGLFLGVYIMTTAIAIICTSVIMFIDVRGLEGNPLPKWAKLVFFKGFARILFVHIQIDSQIRTDGYYETIEKSLISLSDTRAKEKGLSSATGRVIANIEIFMRTLWHRKVAKENYQRIRNEWSLLCSVLDRICLAAFLTFSIGFTAVLFIS